MDIHVCLPKFKKNKTKLIAAMAHRITAYEKNGISMKRGKRIFFVTKESRDKEESVAS